MLPLLLHRSPAVITVSIIILQFAFLAELHGQAPGRLVGRVLDAADNSPVVGATVSVEDERMLNFTNEDGRFVLLGIPVGLHTIRVERIGYQTHRLEGVFVATGQGPELQILLQPTALPVAGVIVEAARRRLIETEVVGTRETVLGTELRMLPIDGIDHALQSMVGVTEGGHFRGGRPGQEIQVVDGLEMKNPLEASTQGSFMEFSPTSIEALEVTTGGFGAEYGSALSGVVSYATRRGTRDSWFREVLFRTDQLSPSPLSAGHTQLNLSAGGPVGFLGEGATLFADMMAKGMIDSDPRARGLTCLYPDDAELDNAMLLAEVHKEPGLQRLLCPMETPRIPHQRGDKFIGFARFDRPLAGGDLHVKALRSRNQSELYTTPFRYNSRHQLGARNIGHLFVLGFERLNHLEDRARRTVVRAAYTGSDRHLGAIDPWTFEDRTRILGFGARSFRFLGEDHLRSNVDEQLASGKAVPGYERPGGTAGSPYSTAGYDLFYTEGTPEIANWTRTHGGLLDLLFEASTPDGHLFRLGGSARRYQIESYERIAAYAPGSAINYARFYPTTGSLFSELRLITDHVLTIDLGMRVEGFDAGLPYLEDRTDFLGQREWSERQISVMPRAGVAATWPGAEDRTVFRFNYSRVSQPPDFRFFLDTTMGDSLRVDIHRQGDPNLGFETGTTFEMSATQLIRPGMAASLTVFHKDLRQLVSGNLQFPGHPEGRFTTGDRGKVNGLELRLRGGWDLLQLRGGYALQKATGLGSTALDTGEVDIREAREYPLAFDRRHVIDIIALGGAAAGAQRPWSVAATGTIQSGLPLDRLLASGDFREIHDSIAGNSGGTASIIDIHERRLPPYLPWNAIFNLRASYELPWELGNPHRRSRLVLDARNLLGLENVRALRPENAQLSPDIEELKKRAAAEADALPAVSRESPGYSRIADLNGDGIIDRDEMATARLAALISAHDPTLFFGARRVIQMGIEVRF